VTAPDGLPRNLGAPATGALVAAGYTDLARLAGVPESELAQLHGVGPTALARLEEAERAGPVAGLSVDREAQRSKAVGCRAS
jgi:hypothetical protein